jgi:tetratricopeptide (TPR) repeat protein
LALSPDRHGELGVRLLQQARELQTTAMARRRDRSAQALPVYRQALEHFRAAATLAPGSSQTHRFCGLTLTELGELEAACASFAQAYRLAPSNADLAAEYASSLQSTGNTAGAVTLYEDALRQHPAHAGLHAGFALTLLGAGDFARGWDEYEWRLKVPQAGIERPFPFARWQGEPLGGRTLLVYTEQGVGDEIMFASCFDELIAAAGHCVLEASTRLVPLFERAFPKATVFARNLASMPDWTRLPRIDSCVAAGSVPRFLRRSREAFPRRDAYLRPEPARLEHWKKRLAAMPRPRIGLAWTGGLPGTLRSARSLSLRDLAPMVGAVSATYLALEFLDCGAEVEAFNREHGARIEWWPQAVSSLDETAAVLAALDLVITVTTATAHLAGALGRPAWVLVPGLSSWRYLWEGDEMPWYPSVRVLRGGGSRQTVVALALQRLKQCYPD